MDNGAHMSFSWSYSAYSKALDCLACYRRRYIDKEEETGPVSGDMVFGSAMHSAWNAVLIGQDGPSVFDLYWTSYANKPMEFSRYKFDDLGKIGHTLLRKFIKSHIHRYEIDKAEIRLYAEYKGVQLEGQFDYWGKLDGKLSLLDLKTSGYNYPKEKAYCALQLNLYAYLAMQNGYGSPEQLGYVVLNKGASSVQEPLVWEFDEAAMYKMLDDMTDYCKMFEAWGSYPKNPNCRFHTFNCFSPPTKPEESST